MLPYLTLAPLEAPQRKYDLREVWGAPRWMVRTGAQWAYLLVGPSGQTAGRFRVRTGA